MLFQDGLCELQSTGYRCLCLIGTQICPINAHQDIIILIDDQPVDVNGHLHTSMEIPFGFQEKRDITSRSHLYLGIDLPLLAAIPC